MVNPNDKAQHKAHIDAVWKRLLIDLATRGITDKDVAGLATDTDIYNNAIRGWQFEVSFKDARPALVYTLANVDGAAILCDGRPLAVVGEA